MSQVLKYAISLNFVAMEGYFERILFWHVLLLKCDFIVISQEKIPLEYNIDNSTTLDKEFSSVFLSTTELVNYGILHKYIFKSA